MPAWAQWVTGVGIIAALTVATVLTGGVAGIKFLVLGSKALKGMSKAKMIGIKIAGGGLKGSVLASVTAGVFGGLSTNGWHWDEAASGFGLGAIFGAMMGAASGGFSSIGKKGLANYAFQIGANATTAGGLNVVKQTVFKGRCLREIDMMELGIAVLFGGLGGLGQALGMEGMRSVGLSAGLKTSENIISLLRRTR